MQIDSTQFPQVWMRLKAPSLDPSVSPFDAFEALLARKKSFVLINDEGLEQTEHQHSPEERKQTSLWMKRHKANLRSFVKAAIYVEPSLPKRLGTKAFASVYEKFWGYPMLVVASKEQALEVSRKLLLGENVDIQAL